MCRVPLQTRCVDVAEFDKRHFILRIGLGFEADMIKGADRRSKNMFGRLAYVFSAAAAFKKLQEADYDLKIDGKAYHTKGFTCIVANSGSVGFSDLSLDKHIDVSDGLLDVIVVRKVNIGLFGHILAAILRHERADNVELVQHWQGKRIRVSSNPPQVLQCDGEIMKDVYLDVKVIPDAARIIVGPQK